MRVRRNHHLRNGPRSPSKEGHQDRGATVPTVKLPAPLIGEIFQDSATPAIQFETGDPRECRGLAGGVGLTCPPMLDGKLTPSTGGTRATGSGHGDAGGP